MKTSKEIARRKREQEKTLIEKIKKLEEKVGHEPTEQTYNEMDKCKVSLEKYMTKECKVSSYNHEYKFMKKERKVQVSFSIR